MAAEEIILVPGFLGFQRLWDLPYFSEAEDLLARPFRARGLDVHVRAIRTLPTASLGQRAARLAEAVAEIPPGARVHLVGHSTGGLDARLFLAPGASLPTDVDVDAAASRVRSLVTVATPHHGTPLATYMTGVHGHRALKLVSMLLSGVLHRSRRSMRGVREISKAVLVLDSLAGIDERFARRLGSELDSLLGELPPSANSVRRLLEDMGEDNALLEQLTPSSLELFNNATRNRPDIDYGCVVAMAPPPTLRRRFRVGINPVAQLSYAVYSLLHRLTSSIRPRCLPTLADEQKRRLDAALPATPTVDDSDGFVPSLSQVWGPVVAAASCDHLDLMGYFGRDGPAHAVDLLTCGADFGAAQFEAVWTAVAKFSLDSSAGY